MNLPRWSAARSRLGATHRYTANRKQDSYDLSGIVSTRVRSVHRSAGCLITPSVVTPASIHRPLPRDFLPPVSQRGLW